jgi:hypothetical protein
MIKLSTIIGLALIPMIKIQGFLVTALFTSLLGLGVCAQSVTSPKNVDVIPTLSPDIEKRIKESTPESLPQDTSNPKKLSDAEEDRLKGKVRTVIEQIKSFSGFGSEVGRHFSTITEYDKRGNRVRRVLFDGFGKPVDVTVYGYIDNFRTSKSESVKLDVPRFSVAVEPGDILLRSRPTIGTI